MKKVLSMCLSVILAFSMFTEVMAANGNMKNFAKKNTYNTGIYKDVKTEEWYNDYVKQCYELALMQGDGDGNFNPEGNVTVAEAITMAARVYNIYQGVTGVFDTKGNNWYDSVVNYAIDNGIIKADTFNNYDRAATRMELASIFAKSLPQSEFNKINTVKEVPDVNKNDSNYATILSLYNSGIIAGSDQAKNFLPNTNIVRA
ncbi:MAG: S-layer homology domain-containing protein, partial [Bacillota bacterium]|nr:S-layer homology domain-containing protein [Bacillota bacterium]